MPTSVMKSGLQIRRTKPATYRSAVGSPSNRAVSSSRAPFDAMLSIHLARPSPSRSSSIAMDVRGVRVLPDLERDALWVSALELDQPERGGVHFRGDPIHRREDALADRDLTAIPASDTIGQDRLAVGRTVAGHQANEERRRVDAAVVGQARLIAAPLSGQFPQQGFGRRRDPPAVDEG